MSDPVTNMDVEDVLSSIRRLVSEEAKTDGEASDAGPADAPQPAENTDANRPGRTARPERPLRSTRRGERPSLRKAEPTPADGGQYEQGVPPSNDVNDGDDADSLQSTEETADQSLDTQKLVLTDALRVAEEDTLAAALSDAVDDQPEEAPTLRSVETVPDKNADRPLRKPTERPKPFQFSSDDTLFERATKAMDALKVQEPKEESTDAASSATATDFDINDLVIQDDSPTDATAPSPAKEADAAPEPHATPSSDEAVTTPANVHADPDEPSTINFVEEEEPVLDEETLRDMISDMVREELQGELGDRITRNVRKLVRREIQRAMTSRNFE